MVSNKRDPRGLSEPSLVKCREHLAQLRIHPRDTCIVGATQLGMLDVFNQARKRRIVFLVRVYVRCKNFCIVVPTTLEETEV